MIREQRNRDKLVAYYEKFVKTGEIDPNISDPDASLYWLSRMLLGGEDPLYVARRLIRFACEDVGMADPNALSVALSAWESYERLGSPEGEIAIAQAVVYLASAPKSISVYRGFNRAWKLARETGSLMPPAHILNAPTQEAPGGPFNCRGLISGTNL